MPAKDTFRRIGNVLWNAITKARMDEAKRVADELLLALDNAIHEIRGDEAPKVQDLDSGYTIRTAIVAIGETVLANNSIFVTDNVAFLADGSDAEKPCHGVCISGTGREREIYWRKGGVVTARLKRNTAVKDYGTVYQSATPGVLTNDPDEAGIVNPQIVGHFRSWTVPRGGMAPDTARIDLMPTGGGAGSGAGVAWGDITGTLAAQTDLQAALDAKQDSLGYGTDGQLLATNATLDGYDWVDPSGGAIALNDLTDVSIATPEQGDVLTYTTGGDWINQKPRDGIALAGESIVEGSIICIDYNGIAWLADGSQQFKYATHIAISGTGEGPYVNYASHGVFDVPTDTDSPYDHTHTMYLSYTNPGRATPNPPDVVDCTKTRQIVGVAIEPRNVGTGTTKISINIGEWVWV